MRRFGLTGNMGCGKSTVAAILAEAGDVRIVDTDDIVRELLRPDDRVEAAFGDSRIMAALEARLVPLVFAEIDRRLAGDFAYGVVESALLYELGVEAAFDGVIVVACGAREQRRRIRARGTHTPRQVGQRLARQWRPAEKLRRARWRLVTSGSIESLRPKVRRLDAVLRSEVCHAL